LPRDIEIRLPIDIDPYIRRDEFSAELPVPYTKTNRLPLDISFGFIHRPINYFMPSINMILHKDKDMRIMYIVPVNEFPHQTYRQECMAPCYGSLSAKCG
jgi:hypothetical protein